ncbi:MAG: sulfite exporter TauE/SafE family protein [Paracoccaceae bacterium]|nr:sulfite exporter TauE/SafE family protein [Paracoccaceae bacterium]MDG2453185.1 sulfite exporter TauE/SafE family protein [Paracoccaceae bacterium]
MTDLLALTIPEMLILCGITFVAGVVRGFSGFALSALVMASAIFILPPVALIPICWWLEMSASIIMARGGWREADRGVVMGLVIGSTVGVPFGLALTTSLPVETSKIVALALIVAAAVLQLAKIRIPFLATKAGLYSVGFAAGIATGLASIGGMIVALYVLSQDAPARKMRAALVMFLFIGALTSLITYLFFGVMDQTAALRGLALIPTTLLGVYVGTKMFTVRLEPYYRPFCLGLLVTLATVGLIRTAL